MQASPKKVPATRRPAPAQPAEVAYVVRVKSTPAATMKAVNAPTKKKVPQQQQQQQPQKMMVPSKQATMAMKRATAAFNAPKTAAMPFAFGTTSMPKRMTASMAKPARMSKAAVPSSGFGQPQKAASSVFRAATASGFGGRGGGGFGGGKAFSMKNAASASDWGAAPAAVPVGTYGRGGFGGGSAFGASGGGFFGAGGTWNAVPAAGGFGRGRGGFGTWGADAGWGAFGSQPQPFGFGAGGFGAPGISFGAPRAPRRFKGSSGWKRETTAEKRGRLDAAATIQAGVPGAWGQKVTALHVVAPSLGLLLDCLAEEEKTNATKRADAAAPVLGTQPTTAPKKTKEKKSDKESKRGVTAAAGSAEERSLVPIEQVALSLFCHVTTTDLSPSASMACTATTPVASASD